MTELQRLREMVQAQERTIEALRAALHQERLDHGQRMRQLERKLREARR